MREGILKNNKIGWLLLGITVLGLGLRVFQLDKHDFWFDEVITHRHISTAYSEKNQYFINNFLEKNPPFYFALLRQWSRIFGKSEFSLRFFSSLLGVLSIVLLYKVSGIFFSRSVSLVAAGFLAVSPFQLWYSQEARAFSLSAALSLLNTYFILKALKYGDNKYWLWYFFSLSCLLFITYFSFFLFVPQAVLILYNRKFILKWLIAFLGFGLLFLIFLYPVFSQQFATLQHKSWLPAPDGPDLILASFINFVIGYNAGPTVFKIASFLIFGVSLFACFNMPVKKLMILLSFLAMPVILAFIFSKNFFPVYIDRNMIMFCPFLYIILSKGISSIKYRWFKSLVVLGFLICILFSLVNYYNDILPARRSNALVFLKKPIRPLVGLFLQNKEEGDIAGFSNYGFMYAFLHYLRQEAEGYQGIPKYYFFISPGDIFFESEIINKRSFGFKSEFEPVNIEKDCLGSLIDKRVWLFSASWKRQGDLEPYARRVKAWFDEHYFKIKEWYVDGIWITVYRI